MPLYFICGWKTQKSMQEESDNAIKAVQFSSFISLSNSDLWVQSFLPTFQILCSVKSWMPNLSEFA